MPAAESEHAATSDAIECSQPDCISNPDLASFLEEMRQRYNASAVSERLDSSRQRAREGYEAVLTFELLLENPISESDPALDAMCDAKPPPSRPQLSSVRGRLPPAAASRK